MNAPQSSTLAGPPRFVSALVSGFNIAAGRIYLLILPIALDLLLWFGPHFRLKALYTPILAEFFDTPAFKSMDANNIKVWRDVLTLAIERFNLLSLLSSVPVGVPSLMTSTLPLKTPLGSPAFFEIASWDQALYGWLLFGLLGLVIGSLYFDLIARATGRSSEPFHLSRLVWETLQTLGLFVFLMILLFVLSIPFGIMLSLFQLVSPGLMQIAMLLGIFLILWILIPLVFTPHGIFTAGQNAFRSMLISGRLVRALFPGVALLLLSGVILAQGLGLLWHFPPEDSWLLLAGIFGNAFIGTGLLSASFVYYRGATAWALSVRKDTPNVRIQV